MENVEITGGSKDLDAVRIEGRPNSEIRDCTIEQRFRYGVTLMGCDGSVIEDSTIDMQSAPAIALWGSTTEVSDIESDGPYPTVISGDDFE